MKALFVAFMMVALASPACWAQESEAEYRELLGLAQKSVERKKQARIVVGARLGASQVARLGLSRRFFEKGQTWRVRFTPSADPAVASIVRKSEPGAPRAPLQATDFEYTVLDAGPDEARILVTQLPGGAPLDARVARVELTVGRDFAPRRREIHYRDGRASLALVYKGTGPLSVGFDATPLELPNLSEDEGEAETDAGAPALRFRARDLYARPVEVLWREGESWPSVVKTVAGTARLVR